MFSLEMRLPPGRPPRGTGILPVILHGLEGRATSVRTTGILPVILHGLEGRATSVRTTGILPVARNCHQSGDRIH